MPLDRLFRIPRDGLPPAWLAALVAAYFTLTTNQAFFRNTYAVFGDQSGGGPFLVSLAIFLFSVNLLVLGLVAVKFLARPAMTVLLVVAAAAGYFMNQYNIVVDTTMLENVMQTDRREVADLLTPSLLLSVLLLGVLPSALLWRVRIRFGSPRQEITRPVKLVAAALALMLASIAPFTAHYASFFREYKSLRYYANPATAVYSTARYLTETMEGESAGQLATLGQDAHIPADDHDRELVVLVVGEAVRADHLGLNGYERQTTPRLSEEERLISFPDVTSCGTATAYSVPCMFSLLPRDDFTREDALHQENLLDVLTHAGVNVLWRDNNSDSKGVATRVQFRDFRTPDNNPLCDTECRDPGMLSGLDRYIEAHPDGDITIVLHQMGNHGPAYYKRFPEQFARFQPYCRSSRLEQCSEEEIRNAYDNAILYSDYFLSRVIDFLRDYDGQFETAMYYMSDHGESLGENGIYLHGLPWYFAPESQKHVASLVWFGPSFEVDFDGVRARAAQPVTHDNYFHTVMGLMEIQSDLAMPSLNLVAPPGVAG